MKPLSLTHKRLGRRIMTLRKELGLTQEDLAFEVGVNRSYMGFIERGERNPSLAMLKKIAKALGVSSSVLFQSV
jgi:transcriptional regulator with XRE-family HTH domain